MVYVSYDVRGLNALPDGIQLPPVPDKPRSVGTLNNFEERRVPWPVVLRSIITFIRTSISTVAGRFVP